MSSYFISTPIYYVNDLPHIGHIYTTVVADTVARYRRLCGDSVFFLTGTDEHGQKILRAAAEKGVEPLALADRVVARYHELWKTLEISHDDFIRTTEERHRQTVEAVIERIAEAGDFYTGRHEGWYCAACENFYTEKELTADKLCPDHGTPAEWKAEENVFFRLSRYQQPLLDWYAGNPGSVRPRSRANEVTRFVEAGLRDLSVSRANLPWGIPFPGHNQQTVYVWMDALTNYISALGYDSGTEAEPYRDFWGANGGERIHLVGKDILRFHAVYWPAFLLSAGIPLPTSIVAHGWWMRDARKMSKSRGNIVRPDELLRQFGPDALRYFLLRDMVFGQDAQFSDEAFVDRYNSDLANDLGNTLSRVTTLSHRTFEGCTPPEAGDDSPLIEVAGAAVKAYRVAMDDWTFDRALKALWGLLAETNQYLVDREPWKLVKTEGPTPRLSRILWNGCEALRIVATGLLPVMPGAARRVLQAIGISEPPTDAAALAWGGTPTGVELPAVEPLFPRIDKKEFFAGAVAGDESAPPTGERKMSSIISIDQFFQTDLRIATVTAAEPIPKSDKLLKLTVDLGEESRVMVAGIAREYSPDDLVGRQVVVVANLEPAKLMGVQSEGMVLAASDDGRPILLHPGSPVPNGIRIK